MIRKAPFARAMARGAVVFAVVFLALPLLAFLAALLLPAYAFGFALVGLVLLMLGFTVALPMADQW